jgi:hypothetical protein
MSARNRDRVHFGAGVLGGHRPLSVFVNCPYDEDYRPAFDAIVFATVCCGFLPRCAFETGATAVPRMDRITQAILSSKYSIHDLCRCRGEGDANLARFNMPVELGVAMAQRFAPDGESNHDWLLLVPRGSSYIRFLSDLAGFDPKQHDGTTDTIVPSVMSWLATRPDAVSVPTPTEVLEALPIFRAEKERLDTAWRGEAPWSDLVLLAMQVARDSALSLPVPTEAANRGMQPTAQMRRA